MENEDKYFEVEGQHEPIISDELFELAQKRIENAPNIVRTKQPKEENYFCGVLRCGICGGKFSTKNVSRKNSNGEIQRAHSYSCVNKIYHNDDAACKSPQITHEKMERAFIEYIKNIDDLTENKGINIEETAKAAEQEILKSIVDNEKKLNKLQDRKRKIMSIFVKGEIEFEEYKNMISLMNEEHEMLEKTLQLKKAELPNIATTPEIVPDDVVTNIRENWENLDNTERMIFLHRFIKKINITVEKEKANSNIVRVKNIEFQLAELQKREKIRPKLKR